MPRKSLPQSFDQVMESVRSHGFEVSAFAGVPGGQLVSKFGAAAVLVPAADLDGSAASFLERPGILVRGEVARLLDRGYQKFITTSQFELPATAQQLEAIHTFSEELKELSRGKSLYNESLGTTSDRYLYDRVQGREETEPKGARPWDSADSH